jgi:hypothetical protein
MIEPVIPIVDLWTYGYQAQLGYCRCTPVSDTKPEPQC